MNINAAPQSRKKICLVQRTFPGLSTRTHPTRWSMIGPPDYLYEMKREEEMDEIAAGLRSSLRSIGKKLSIHFSFGGGKPNMLTNYFAWALRANYLWFIFSMVVIFFVMILIFSVIIYACKKNQPHCLNPVDGVFANTFTGAFSMAWTTFSTVGYGNTSGHYSNECVGVNLIISTGAFIGILYAGTFVAVFYRKGLNSLCVAHVSYSDVCVIRYGEIKPDYHHRPTRQNGFSLQTFVGEDIGMNPQPKIVPALVFRIANNLHNLSFGRIRNFSLSCSAVTTIKYSEEDHRLNPSLSPRYFYPSMRVTPTKLPYLDTVVYVRHDLDESSPLLKKETKILIRENNGSWPADLSTAEAIADQLDYEEIIVEMKGLSSIENIVWSHKRYKRENLKIGYKFVDMAFESDGNNIRLNLLNEIREHRVY